jgi:hypothetical protein
MMMEQKDLGPVWRGPVGTQGPASGHQQLEGWPEVSPSCWNSRVGSRPQQLEGQLTTQGPAWLYPLKGWPHKGLKGQPLVATSRSSDQECTSNKGWSLGCFPMVSQGM